MIYKGTIILANPNFEDSPLVRRGGIGIFFPNIGIDSIHTNLKCKYPDLSIYVVDGVLHNLNNKQTKEEILEKEPRIIGFSTTYVTLRDSLNILKETFMTQGDTHGHENNKVFSYQIKKEEPTIITVLGGVGAKSLNVLSKGEHVEGLDYCVMGDGERIFEKIIKENERPNKTKYLEDIIYDLDSLEFPKRKAFDTERYIKILQKVNTLNRNERYLNIFTSKGCDWGKCTFCTVDRHYRTKSPEKIRAEVEYLVEEFKITKLFTCDDNFFCYKDPERTYRICETLQKFPYLKWSVGETRVTDFVKNVNLGKKILRKMRGSGCVEINWGAESGDPQLLKNMQKGISPSDIEMAIRMTTEAGMISKLLLMYNLPGETKESLDNTLNFVKNLLVKYPINFLKVSEYANIPGTIDWYRGHNSDVSKTDVEGFMSELSDFCSVNNIVLSFLNWERTGDEKSSCRI